ncbi:TetR/AcrR family transcriptional regulator [Streptomyces daliensis]|uniref:TetR/AcrR family transcriptional regulator n=1 Tax=Streptomyces daliensis TaxID=299421 RepID=A0A8T4IJX8_9ACTN|nr:TetR/AcrR family transcriptional regulator [Streptomyces daliensis]
MAEKREAITRGARTVFGRDGYTRTSIDAIAKEAGVSTRTIYNHFEGGKAELFRLIVEEGATQIHDVQLDVIDRWLRKVTDLEADLIDFGRAWVEPLGTFPDHFALVRQLRAEVGHLPSELLRAWEEAGPVRVEYALADRFRSFADEGLLQTDDPRQAASHFIQLISGEIIDRSYYGALPLPADEVTRLITSGVHAFLNGYLPR